MTGEGELNQVGGRPVHPYGMTILILRVRTVEGCRAAIRSNRCC